MSLVCVSLSLPSDSSEVALPHLWFRRLVDFIEDVIVMRQSAQLYPKQSWKNVVLTDSLANLFPCRPVDIIKLVRQTLSCD